PDLTDANHQRDLQRRRAKAARKKVAVKKRLASKKAKLAEAHRLAERAIKQFDAAYQREGTGPEQDTPTKVESNYRYADNPDRSCGECKFFDGSAGCSKVDGLIREVDVCDWFEEAKGE